MSQWTTEPIFNSLGLIGLVALALALVTFLVGPSSTSLTAGQRRTLIGLRALALVVLVVSLIRPTLVHTDEQPAPATLAILLDSSRSMTLTSGGEGSRWEVQREVWEKLRPVLESKDETLNISVYQYDSDLRPLEATPDVVDAFLDGAPDGKSTDLALALREALTRAGGQPLAGIVLVGDGTQTVGVGGAASRLPGPQSVASTLAALEVPLWTVPIGPRLDPSTARDVAIDGMSDEFQVFTKNLFTVTASMSARGLDGRSIPVKLMLIDTEGNSQELARREITAGGDDDDRVVTMEVPAPAPGNYQLALAADIQDGEVLTTNNQQIAFLDVREGGGRILYLEGEPRQEQLFLRRSIDASNDFEVAFQWLERPRGGKTWPIDMGVAFSDSRYDVYILGDLDADALGKTQLTKLRERVAAGSGLLVLGGYQSFDAGGYGDSPLEAALPVKMSRGRKQRLGNAPDPRFHIDGPLKVQLARPHPINRIFPGEAQQAGWSALRPLLGANRLLGPKPIPGVQVLLETENKDPLLVVGEFGKGRVVTFAADSTYVWWRQGQKVAHRRFWRQVLLWLLRREDAPPNHVAIDIDQRRFASDAEVGFRAVVRGADGQTIDANLTAQIIDDQQAVTPLPMSRSQSDANAESSWSGIIKGLPDGIYRLRVADPVEDSDVVPSEIAFQVLSIDRELSRPLADIAQMEQLAQLTGEVGGASVAPEEAQRLKEIIDEHRGRAMMPIVSKWRLGDEPIGSWIVLALFAGLLTTDWILRKRWGMV